MSDRMFYGILVLCSFFVLGCIGSRNGSPQATVTSPAEASPQVAAAGPLTPDVFPVDFPPLLQSELMATINHQGVKMMDVQTALAVLKDPYSSTPRTMCDARRTALLVYFTKWSFMDSQAKAIAAKMSPDSSGTELCGKALADG